MTAAAARRRVSAARVGGRPAMPRGAPDGGMTAIEAVVDVVVVGVVMSAMASLLLLSMNSFTPVKDVGNEPDQAAQRELSRRAARMLAGESCDNPSGETTRSECLDVAATPFPRPYPPPSPAWSGYPRTSPSTVATESVVCWMVKAEDPETRPVGTAVPHPDDDTKTYTYLNPDERDLECWYHAAVAVGGPGRLLAAMHYPYEEDSYGDTASDQDSSDLFMPSWSAEPYRVSLVTTGIGGFGESGDGSNPKGWICVEGADPDPASQLASSTTTLPQRREKGCDDAIWKAADSPGTAVLSVNLCVLLSPDELKRRRSLVRLEAARGEQTDATACADVPACAPAADDTVELCEPTDVTVSPGRG